MNQATAELTGFVVGEVLGTVVGAAGVFFGTRSLFKRLANRDAAQRKAMADEHTALWSNPDFVKSMQQLRLGDTTPLGEDADTAEIPRPTAADADMCGCTGVTHDRNCPYGL